MKTFEEKFTAWVDGKLIGPELADFENELSSVANAAEDKVSAQRLGDFLREHVVPASLTNADFFSHRIHQQIESERAPRAGARTFFWTVPRLAWAGACCLLVALGLFFSIVPKTDQPSEAGEEYVAKVLNMEHDDPEVSITAYHDRDENVTVLWLDGLAYIPASNELK